MGKPTGFMEYERKTAAAVSPKERIKNFCEFHTPLSQEEQRKQAARCMNCGVPFCQAGMNIMGMTSGCPLHNLVPEWNDLVYTGNLEQAYNRLKKTNNFPEFTSRVCPALCEAACTCGHYGDPVSVKGNEYGIIENAYDCLLYTSSYTHDGPASILFSDGDVMGAILDRNGLRPSRYYVTDDDYLILSSEVGVLDIDPTKIVAKERLRPGKMLLVDTKQGRIIDDEELKETYAGKQPYGEWLDRNLICLENLKIPNERVPEYSKEERQRMQKAFGYTYESLKDAILPMAKNGGEGTSAMGIDTPLAALAGDHQPLFNYFKQLFAQVTNPPIDSIREKVVTSTTVYIGEDGNLLEEKAINCQVLKVNNPILTNTDIMKIKSMNVEGFKVAVLPIIYYKNTSLEKAVDHLFVEADRAYRDGANILILSDRGVDENHVPIPSLLAVSGLQQHLVKTKKRTAVAMILESGEPREVHHFATLLGYGACAINPYLAQDTVCLLYTSSFTKKRRNMEVY